MNKNKQYEAAPPQPARYPRRGALRALWVLETCPSVPVDAFVHLAGLSSQSGAYQQLARLRHAGLAVARRVDPGYLMGERPLGCWTITDKGRRVLGLAHCQRPGNREIVPQLRSSARGLLSRQAGEGDAPLLLATYRILAALVCERRARGQPVEVQQLEWPWVRERLPAADGRFLRVRMPGGAILLGGEPTVNSDRPSERLTQVLLVPDLGTAPVVRYREMLRRVATLQEEIVLADSDGELEVVIVTPDPDGLGSRRRAWLELLNRAGCRQAECPLQVRVLTWDWVAERVTPVKSADGLGDDRSGICSLKNGSIRARSLPAPARSHEQLLHLIGRHPCLTVDQLARVLGTAVDRIRRLEEELIGDGILRRIEYGELPRGGTVITHGDFAALGLVDITSPGRRRLAAWLGVEPAVGRRYHGLTGNGSRDAGRRWKLLRTLAHTVEANDVFVAFAVAAEAVRRDGGTDELVEWRSAAACERKHCKPDGYGCYVRHGVAHGFFLEYDRGTERARRYAAKLRAYYSYRDSAQATRDYNGFPSVLFVTTDSAAEERITEAADRAWFIRGTEPLPVLVTTTVRMMESADGILGPIWRVVPTEPPFSTASLRAWPLISPLLARAPHDLAHLRHGAVISELRAHG